MESQSSLRNIKLELSCILVVGKEDSDSDSDDNNNTDDDGTQEAISVPAAG